MAKFKKWKRTATAVSVFFFLRVQADKVVKDRVFASLPGIRWN